MLHWPQSKEAEHYGKKCGLMFWRLSHNLPPITGDLRHHLFEIDLGSEFAKAEDPSGSLKSHSYSCNPLKSRFDYQPHAFA
jgi:hypothetical protein